MVLAADDQFFQAGKPLKAWGVLIFDRHADKDGVGKSHSFPERCLAKMISEKGFMAQFARVLQMQGKS